MQSGLLPRMDLVYNKHITGILFPRSFPPAVPRAGGSPDRRKERAAGGGSARVDMEIKFKPRGVCSQAIRLDLTDGIVHNVKFTGGCSGNAQGLCRLVEGMEAREVVARLRGIRCGRNSTSCPDQLAAALEQALAGGQK